jgi:hypothetical protein
MTHSLAKGVSSEEINRAPVDRGNWNVVTVYGLLYSVEDGGAR